MEDYILVSSARRMASRLMSNVYDEEDLYQDVQLAKIMGKKQIDRWAMVDALRLFYGRKFTETRHSSLDTDEISKLRHRRIHVTRVTPEMIAMDRELRDMIRRAVWALRPDQRMAVWLFFFEERTQVEIASALGIHPTRICQLIAVGCARLRKSLGWWHDANARRIEPRTREPSPDQIDTGRRDLPLRSSILRAPPEYGMHALGDEKREDVSVRMV